VKFIGAHRERWGVEPICEALQVAPSTYYASISRPPSARYQRDEQLKVDIARVHRENFGVYGIEKVWHQLNREGIQVGRDRVHRLMQEMDLEGVVRGTRKRITTVSIELDTRPPDLVERNFTAAAPNGLWVADRTYVSTCSGFCYVAFVIDVFSRCVVGWRVSNSLHADLALDALQMAIWRRRRSDLSGLVHHSDRGIKNPSVNRKTTNASVESANISGMFRRPAPPSARSVIRGAPSRPVSQPKTAAPIATPIPFAATTQPTTAAACS
jgi:putative transposase